MQHREPLDAVAGGIGGAFFGFFVYLYFATSGIQMSTIFPLNILGFVTIGALAGAPLGYWQGSDFFRWIRDNWPGSWT